LLISIKSREVQSSVVLASNQPNCILGNLPVTQRLRSECYIARNLSHAHLAHQLIKKNYQVRPQPESLLSECHASPPVQDIFRAKNARRHTALSLASKDIPDTLPDFKLGLDENDRKAHFDSTIRRARTALFLERALQRSSTAAGSSADGHLTLSSRATKALPPRPKSGPT
jgi:hypothetical protein